MLHFLTCHVLIFFTNDAKIRISKTWPGSKWSLQRPQNESDLEAVGGAHTRGRRGFPDRDKCLEAIPDFCGRKSSMIWLSLPQWANNGKIVQYGIAR